MCLKMWNLLKYLFSSLISSHVVHTGTLSMCEHTCVLTAHIYKSLICKNQASSEACSLGVS